MARIDIDQASIRSIVEKQIQRLVRDVTSLVQRELASQVADFISRDGHRGAVRVSAPRAGIKRDMSCIAPGCRNRSKGPRFSYLCEKHLKASKKQIRDWQDARRKAKASA